MWINSLGDFSQNALCLLTCLMWCQRTDLMAKARGLKLQGAVGSVEQIFAALYAGKSVEVPGQDEMGTGTDQSTSLLDPQKQTAVRLKTSKIYNVKQKPLRLPGSEGWS